MADRDVTPITVTAITALAAGNLYARVPVMQARIEPPKIADLNAASLGEAFEACLAGQHEIFRGAMAEVGRAVDEATPTVPDRASSVAGVIGRLAIRIQNVAGMVVGFHRVLPRDGSGAVGLVVEYRFADIGKAALKLAVLAFGNAMRSSADRDEAGNGASRFAAGLDALTRAARGRAVNAYLRPVVLAAERRGIPWSIADDNTRLFHFGEGRLRRRSFGAATPATSYIAGSLAGDKHRTGSLLRDNGIPTPRQTLVASNAAAIAAARRIGFPVVVKPLDAHGGRGVSVGLRDPAEVERAYARAVLLSRDVLVESYLPGADHRLLVLGGGLVSAIKRTPAHVVGDGRLTIAQLIERANADPRRRDPIARLLEPLVSDAESERLLRQRGYELSSVPPLHDVVYLRSAANRSQGATCLDVTDRVHPDNREVAERAARLVGLDAAGIDFLCPDISRSCREVGGGICEVNREPGLLVHFAADNPGPDVANAWLDHLFSAGDTGRIPIATVAGGAPARAVAHRLAAVLRASGRTVGLCASDGWWSGEFEVSVASSVGPASVGRLIRDPMIDAAVIETSFAILQGRGLGHHRCDVSALLRTPGERPVVAQMDEMAAAMRALTAVTEGAVVIDADDAECRRAVAFLGRQQLYGVTTQAPARQPPLPFPTSRLVHTEPRGGLVHAVITTGDREIAAYPFPTRADPRAIDEIRGLLCVVAMAHGLGLDLEQIAAGVSTIAWG